LKTSLKKDELPIVGSVFYSLHIQPNRPRGHKLDMKQTSYKKLNKFLLAMAREGFVQVKTLPKGELSVVSFNENHDKLVEFDLHPIEKSNDAPQSQHPKQHQSQQSKEPEKKEDSVGLCINRIYRPTPELLAVFTVLFEDVKKDTIFTKQQATDALWAYTEAKELSQPGSDGVTLDQTLARGAFRKQKTEGDQVTKEELSKAFGSALQSLHEISRDGVSTIM
jgi:translation initiation factor 2D